ncbi:MAG: co-chaperone GroES [Vampirovibrionales bacterium]
MATVRPAGDRYAIEVLEDAAQTAGGIYIPDSAKEKPQQGIIRFAGAGRLTDKGERIAPDFKVGDKVVFAKYAGTDVKVDGQEYKILSEKDILCVIEG